MARKHKDSKSKETHGRTFADVLYLIIDKGIGLPLACWFLIMLMIWKMSPQGVDRLYRDVRHTLRTYYVWGYVIAVVLLFLLIKTRKMYLSEIERIAKERDLAQKNSHTHNKPIASSE